MSPVDTQISGLKASPLMKTPRISPISPTPRPAKGPNRAPEINKGIYVKEIENVGVGME